MSTTLRAARLPLPTRQHPDRAVKAVEAVVHPRAYCPSSRAQHVDREVSRINGSAPAGPYRHLRQVECVARGLPSFSSAVRGVQLPDYERSNRMAWPVRGQPSLPVTPAMVSHPGADWAAHQRERAEAIRREHERTIAYYDAMARQREEREAAKTEERGH